jgi:hypothetical protein
VCRDFTIVKDFVEAGFRGRPFLNLESLKTLRSCGHERSMPRPYGMYTQESLQTVIA